MISTISQRVMDALEINYNDNEVLCHNDQYNDSQYHDNYKDYADSRYDDYNDSKYHDYQA